MSSPTTRISSVKISILWLPILIAWEPSWGAGNWIVDEQLSGDTPFVTCQHCSFSTADGGTTLTGSGMYSGALTVAHYGPNGDQRWMYEDAGNFQFPQGPLSASLLDDGSLCVLSQNLLPVEQNTLAAIKLDANGRLIWQTQSLGFSVEQFVPSNGIIACTPDGGAAVAHDGAVIRINSAGIVQWSELLDNSFGNWISSVASRPDSSIVAAGYIYSGQYPAIQFAPTVVSIASDGEPEWNLRDTWQSGAGGENAYVAADGSIRFIRQFIDASGSRLRVSSADRTGNVGWDDLIVQTQETDGSVGAMLDTRFALAAMNFSTPLTYRLLEFDSLGHVALDQPPAQIAGATQCAAPVLVKAESDAVLVAYPCRSNNNSGYLSDIRRIDSNGAVTFRRDLNSSTGPTIDGARWDDATDSAFVFGYGNSSSALAPLGLELTPFGPDSTLFSSLITGADTLPLAMLAAPDGYLVLYGSQSKETFSKLDVSGLIIWAHDSSDNVYDGTAQVVAMDDGGAARVWRTGYMPEVNGEIHAERISSKGRFLWRVDVPAGDGANDGSLVAAWVRSNDNIEAILSDGIRVDISQDGTSTEQSALPLPSFAQVLFVQSDKTKPWSILASGISIQGGTPNCWVEALDRDAQVVGSAAYPCAVDSGSVSLAQFSVASFDGTAFIAALNTTQSGLTNQVDVIKLDLTGNVLWNTPVVANGGQRISASGSYIFLSLNTYGFASSFGAMLRDDGTLMWQRELSTDVGVNLQAAPYTDGSLVGTAISSSSSTMNLFSLDASGALRFVDRLPVKGLATVYTPRFGFEVVTADQMVFGTFLTDQAEKRHAIFGVFGDAIFSDGFEQ